MSKEEMIITLIAAFLFGFYVGRIYEGLKWMKKFEDLFKNNKG